MEDKPTSGRWRGLITRHNAKRKTEREQEGSGIVQTVITLGFALGIGAALVLLQGPIQDAISDAGDKTASTFAEMTGTSVGGGGAGGGGAVETPDDDPIETVGTLSKSRFQTYMGENQNATELTFDAVSYDGMAYTDVSEEQNGSVLAFMEGDTMHVTAANGGKVGLPKSCYKMFCYSSTDSTWESCLPNASIFDMSNCNTLGITNMACMFYACTSLTEINGLENWNTSNVTDMHSMFWRCSSLKSLDLSSWDISNVTDMESMFKVCDSIESLNLSGWDTSNVTNMRYMFWSCLSLIDINGLENWDTSNVTNMYCMFYTRYSLTSLDLSGWDTSKVTDMSSMFASCKFLTEIKVGDGWDTSNANTSNMFINCGTDHVTHV